MDTLKEKLDKVLYALLGRQELVEMWWRSPNKAFDDNTPSSIFEKHPERVKQYLFAQLNGDYS